MIGIALVCMVVGVVCGLFFFSPEANAAMDTIASAALKVLIFTVGIDIGCHKEVFAKIKGYGVKLLLIPLGVVAGTLAGGLLVGALFGLRVGESGAIAAGLGWYSISAVLLKEIGGAQLGTAAFLTNIFREVLTVFSIPLVVKLCGPIAAVAPGGATSMDTTLPIVAKYTDEETAVISVVSGVVTTALVPVLVPFFYGLPF